MKFETGRLKIEFFTERLGGEWCVKRWALAVGTRSGSGANYHGRTLVFGVSGGGPDPWLTGGLGFEVHLGSVFVGVDSWAW